MTEAEQKIIWDILESEAWEKYYIDDAERPAFLMLHKYSPLSGGGFELYINSLARVGAFRFEKEARERLLKIMSKANKSVKYYRQSKTGRNRDKKVFFAEADGKGNLTIVKTEGSKPRTAEVLAEGGLTA